MVRARPPDATPRQSTNAGIGVPDYQAFQALVADFAVGVVADAQVYTNVCSCEASLDLVYRVSALVTQNVAPNAMLESGQESMSLRPNQA